MIYDIDDYTVEVYKSDFRYTNKERLVEKKDFTNTTIEDLTAAYSLMYPKHRIEIHKTFVTKRNHITGAEFQERYDTPYYCSPSSETYWSM